MYLLYSVVTAAGMLLLAPYFLIKGLRHQKYLSNLPERFAWRFPPEIAAATGGSPDAIWLHAVSVGETLAAVPLARALKERFPGRRLVISTTTSTGQAVARERLGFADGIFYFPFDWCGPVRRSLDAVRPAAVIILETEIWPNFLHEAGRRRIPVLFINGRFSDRSFRRTSLAISLSGGLLRGFIKDVLSQAKLFLAQTEIDRSRLLAFGAPVDHVIVAGNMKYDLALPKRSPLVEWLSAELERCGRRPLVVAGSVVAGEEPAVLQAFRAVSDKWPGALLLMAPRKPERFDPAAEIIERAGWRVVRRSGLSCNGTSNGVLESVHGEPDTVFLLDTIGELSSTYGIADAVFVGGSLRPTGGHNPLEPAALGRVPVYGPSMENFKEISDGLLKAEAAVQVHSGEELAAAWIGLLSDEPRRTRMGEVARRLVERNRGATEAALERISAALDEVGTTF